MPGREEIKPIPIASHECELVRQGVVYLLKRKPMENEALGVVRIAPQVLSTIVTNAALDIAGVTGIARPGGQRTNWLSRERHGQGVSLTVKNNTVSADLYLVVATGANIVDVGISVQEEVSSALEHIVGMQVREVNVYIQDVT